MKVASGGIRTHDTLYFRQMHVLKHVNPYNNYIHVHVATFEISLEYITCLLSQAQIVHININQLLWNEVVTSVVFLIHHKLYLYNTMLRI